jgi:D-alanyl-lipoteichoic acid acyltransferase DltB (MBOAT superfamily)
MRIAYPAAAILTMLLCGLWHGAGITYIVWGGMHGLFLVIERLAVYRNKAIQMRARIRSPKEVARFLIGLISTQLLVTVAWLVFRAQTLDQVGYFLSQIIHWQGSEMAGNMAIIVLTFSVMTLVLDIIEYASRSDMYLLRLRPAVTVAICVGIFSVVCLYLATTKPLPFVYSQF